jgi:hypothetical protein
LNLTASSPATVPPMPPTCTQYPNSPGCHGHDDLSLMAFSPATVPPMPPTCTQYPNSPGCHSALSLSKSGL